MGLRSLAKKLAQSAPASFVLDSIGSTKKGRHALNKLDWPHGVFPNFEEGWKAAKTKSQQGHGYATSVQRHFQLSSDLRESDKPVIEILNGIPLDNIRLYDFGGNAGNLYYSYRPKLKKHVCWVVTDVPNIMEEGDRIARERNVSHELRFTDKPSGAGQFDVLLISGAFHYWEKTVAEFMSQLACKPKYVVINRSPFHEVKDSFITIQRLNNCAFPSIIRNRTQFVAEFRSLGYELHSSWAAPEVALNIPLFPAWSVRSYSGLCFTAQEL